MTRSRLFVFIAFCTFALAVAYAVADSMILNTGGPRESRTPGSGYIEGAAGTPIGPDGAERGYVTGLDTRLAADQRDKRKDRDRTVRAAVILDGEGEPENTAASCADACVGDIRPQQLVPRVHVRERLAEILTIRECTSAIGGEATCFDFGEGAYLVGDAPTDGAAELGFCTSAGYYFVSGPSLDGGAGTACPGEAGKRARGGDAPVARDCTSSVGGEATCFDFGGGNYIVSDPFADGEGELGFCTSGNDAPAGPGYYYVSAPASEGGAGGECPPAR